MQCSPLFGHLLLSTPTRPGFKAQPGFKDNQSASKYEVRVSAFGDSPGLVVLDNQTIAEGNLHVIKLEQSLKRLGEDCIQTLKNIPAGGSKDALGDRRALVYKQFSQKIYDVSKRQLQRILIGLSGTLPDAERRGLLKVVRQTTEYRVSPPVMEGFAQFTSCDFLSLKNTI
jgi:hypothetical protein